MHMKKILIRQNNLMNRKKNILNETAKEIRKIHEVITKSYLLLFSFNKIKRILNKYSLTSKYTGAAINSLLQSCSCVSLYIVYSYHRSASEVFLFGNEMRELT